MDIKTLAPAEAINAVKACEDIAVIRSVAEQLLIKFSGNSGIETIKGKIIDALEAQVPDSEDVIPEGPTGNSGPVGSEGVSTVSDILGDNADLDIQIAPDPVFKPKPPTLAMLATMDAKHVEDPVLRRQIVRAKALRLHRVTITNLNAAENTVLGEIVTVYNKYTGKVSKHIPFGDESAEGYHVPEILLNHLKSQKYVLRREIKGGQYGVKKYKTTMQPRFSIQYLDKLKEEELANLAATQQASGNL